MHFALKIPGTFQRARWRDYVSFLASCLEIPEEELESVAGDKTGMSGFPSWTFCLCDPTNNKGLKMD